MNLFEWLACAFNHTWTTKQYCSNSLHDLIGSNDDHVHTGQCETNFHHIFLYYIVVLLFSLLETSNGGVWTPVSWRMPLLMDHLWRPVTDFNQTIWTFSRDASLACRCLSWLHASVTHYRCARGLMQSMTHCDQCDASQRAELLAGWRTTVNVVDRSTTLSNHPICHARLREMFN